MIMSHHNPSASECQGRITGVSSDTHYLNFAQATAVGRT